MAISKKFEALLKKHGIDYKALKHKTVFTAHDMAQTLKAKMDQVVKTVVVKTDKNHVMICLPASMFIDFKKLKKVLNTKKLEIAKEQLLQKLLKSEPGNIIPVGKLYDLPLYLDKALVKAKEIVARAGSYEDSVVLKAKDFITLSQPIVADFGAAMKKTASKLKVAAKKAVSKKVPAQKAKKPAKAKKRK